MPPNTRRPWLSSMRSWATHLSPIQLQNESTHMNIKSFGALLVVFALAALLFITGCDRTGTNGPPSDVAYYTCTMHPSVKSHDPKAKCPICSMDLVPVKKTQAAPTNHVHGQTSAPAPETNSVETPTEFVVPIERQQQIGVTYAIVQKQP